jgi:hypothetical protein
MIVAHSAADNEALKIIFSGPGVFSPDRLLARKVLPAPPDAEG